MEVLFLQTALRDLKSLTPSDSKRIRSKIYQYAASPTALANNVKALRGSDLLRLRVGDWRVLFSVEDEQVTIMYIHRVRHRREAYD